MSKKKEKKRKDKGGELPFFADVRHEMSLVKWPIKPELARYTAISIAISAVIALIFWGVDSGILAALGAAIK